VGERGGEKENMESYKKEAACWSNRESDNRAAAQKKKKKKNLVGERGRRNLKQGKGGGL